jgi:hypothetical protein
LGLLFGDEPDCPGKRNLLTALIGCNAGRIDVLATARARAGTAADIDNTLALPQVRSLQRCLQDRAHDDVQRLLEFDPMAAASTIPVGDFSFILWVVLGL